MRVFLIIPWQVLQIMQSDEVNRGVEKVDDRVVEGQPWPLES